MKPQHLRTLWAPSAIVCSLGIPDHTLWKIYFIFSLFWLSAYMQKISMIQSFKQEVFVRILYSTNWLKPFQAITQEQEFSKIRDLYSKIDNNIIFIYRQFQQKSKAKCFKMEKPCFWVTFDHFCSFCQKGVFAKIWG